MYNINVYICIYTGTSMYIYIHTYVHIKSLSLHTYTYSSTLKSIKQMDNIVVNFCNYPNSYFNVETDKLYCLLKTSLTIYLIIMSRY